MSIYGADSENANPPPARRHLADRRGHEVVTFEHGGFRFTLGIGRFPNRQIAEIFLDAGKPNSAVQAHASDSAVLVSLLLQHGVPLEVIRHSVSGPIRSALDLLVADEDGGRAP